MSAAGGPLGLAIGAAAAFGPALIKGIGGMFSKPKENSGFDFGREQLWSQFTGLDRQFGGGGGLNLNDAQLRQWLGQVESISTQHQALGQSFLQQGGDPDWLRPRFDDFQNTFNNRISDINGILSSRSTAATPAAAAGAGSMPSITIAPVFNFPDADITALEVRDIVMPEITATLESAVRGYRERWSQLLSSKGSTPAPVGI